MKNYKSLILSSLVLLLFGCDQAAQSTATTNDAAPEDSASAVVDASETGEKKLIATVNTSKVYMSDFEEFATQRIQENPQLQQTPQLLLNELINRELLLQTARAEGYDQREEVTKQIKRESDSIILAVMLDEKLKDTDLSDEALQTEYQSQLSSITLKEYNARHILVQEKAEAEAIISQLQSGSDFATLAKEKSTGPTAENGGDLGWFRSETMVAEFSNAMVQLNTGGITNAPVETRFGWHVIKLEGTRDLTPPTFEESKERLKSIIANKAAQAYLSTIRTDAKIDIYDPETGKVVSGEQLSNAAEEATKPVE